MSSSIVLGSSRIDGVTDSNEEKQPKLKLDFFTLAYTELIEAAVISCPGNAVNVYYQEVA